MITEQQKMLAGELYDALDPELVAGRVKARKLCQQLNAAPDGDEDLRRQLCKQIFRKGGDTVWMQPPFYCDYGSNIELGERVFFNFNCIVLDVCVGVIVIIEAGWAHGRRPIKMSPTCQLDDTALRISGVFGVTIRLLSDRELQQLCQSAPTHDPGSAANRDPHRRLTPASLSWRVTLPSKLRRQSCRSNFWSELCPPPA